MASIAVLAGGISAEREISIITGNKIGNSLKRNGYKVRVIDAVGDFWLELLDYNPDSVFIALHGRFGEDGTIQGMLDMMNIEYVGSGVLASAVAMDKISTKHIFRSLNIPTPGYHVLEKDLFEESIIIPNNIKFPLVIKPSCEGSAIGISIANSESDVESCLNEAMQYSGKLLVEEFIDGPEVTVGILGDDPPKVLEVVQIIHSNTFYDFDAKYTPGKSKHLIPPDLPDDILKECKVLALKAHKALNCRDFSRVDIKISSDLKQVTVLEINTIPGMTETSLYPEAAAASGYGFDELTDFLIKLPLKRKADKQKIASITG